MSDKNTKKNPRQDKESKRKHYLSLWVEDPDVKAQMEVMAEAEGRSLNNYFNNYVAPKVRAIIMAQLADKPDHMRKALEEELKTKTTKAR